MISIYVFLLVLFLVSIIMLIAWKLPKNTKPQGLISVWRWIVITSTLFMCHEGSTALPHYKIISPALWTASIVLMCGAVFNAAKQNCKPVWGRLLACLLLDIAIYIDLLIIYH
ncbi:MAG: hypothetical protein IJ760_02820 [Bacteroidales bacterium]|nr:hypothetical protein [Bacteroidales bacterium]